MGPAAHLKLAPGRLASAQVMPAKPFLVTSPGQEGQPRHSRSGEAYLAQIVEYLRVYSHSIFACKWLWQAAS